MGVRMGNGSSVDTSSEQSAPPWANVDPWAIIIQLQQRLVSLDTEMAAMRIYIDQLHEALAQVTIGKTEDANGAVVPTRDA